MSTVDPTIVATESYAVDVHFETPMVGGRLRSAQHDHTAKTRTIRAMAIACDPSLAVRPIHTSSEPEGASCANCRNTAAWKVAMRSVLVERSTPASSPLWEQVGGYTPPAAIATAAATVTSAPIVPASPPAPAPPAAAVVAPQPPPPPPQPPPSGP